MNVVDPVGLAYQYTCHSYQFTWPTRQECQVLSQDNCTLSYTVASFLLIVLVYAVYSDVGYVGHSLYVLWVFNFTVSFFLLYSVYDLYNKQAGMALGLPSVQGRASLQ